MVSTVEREFDEILLANPQDVREVRMRLRVMASDLHMQRRAQFEFMSACTAMARSLMRVPGRNTVGLDVIVQGARVGVRAVFTHYPHEASRDSAGPVVRALMSGLPNHRIEDVTQLVDQVDIGRVGDRDLSASIVRWVR